MSALELATITDNVGKPIFRPYDMVINSEDRLNYLGTSSTNFRINVNNPVISVLVGYGLKSAVIPKTNYNIPAIRNTFQIKDSIDTKTVTVPAGNYTMTELLTEIQSILNGFGVDTYTVTYSAITGKVTITSTYATFELNPNLVYQQGSVLYKLGFNPTIAYFAVAGTLTAPNVADISGIKNVFIKIKQLTQYMRNTTNSMLNFKVDFGGCFGSIIYFSDEAKYHQYFNVSQDSIQSQGFYDISLVDEYGFPVDLNGRDWSFVLQLVTK